MSCTCVRIILKTTPTGLPSWMYDADGLVSFDLSVTQKFSKSKNVEQLSIFQTISGSGVLGFSLPQTDKNKLLLKGFGNPNAYQFDNSVLVPVTVFENSEVLEQDSLRILSKSGSNRSWEAELVDSDTFWKTALQNCRLCDLDFGTFTQNQANLTPNWTSNSRYDDGDDGVWFPLVSYGNWFNPASFNPDGTVLISSTANVPDFRPWFHILAVLQKMFCKVGWVFRSPVLETDWGRRLIQYLTVDFTAGAQLEKWTYRAGVASDYVWGTGLTNTVLQTDDDFTAPNYDEGVGGLVGFFVIDPLDPGTANSDFHYYYAFGLSGENSFYSEMTLTNPVTSLSSIVAGFDIQVINPLVVGAGALIASFVSGQISIAPGATETISFTTPSVQVSPGWRVVCKIVVVVPVTAFPPTIAADSHFFNIPVNVELIGDLEYKIASTIDCELKSLDFLRGVLHLIDGRLDTDSVNRIVTLYPPEDTQTPDAEDVDGFYRPSTEAIDIDGQVLCETEEVEINRSLQNRFYRLCFANADDQYVLDLGYNNDNPIWAKLLDFGTDKSLLDETTEDCNPFYEGTAQIFADEIVPLGQNPVEIPALWDNDERDISTSLNPRILYAAGYVQQFWDSAPVYRQWLLAGGVRTFLPFAFQLTTMGLTSSNVVPQEAVVYGDDDRLDLYTMFWSKTLAERIAGVSIEYLVMIDNCFYKDTNFRDRYRFTYDGKPRILKLESISDFRPCDNTSTPLSFRQDIDDCGLES